MCSEIAIPSILPLFQTLKIFPGWLGIYNGAGQKHRVLCLLVFSFAFSHRGYGLFSDYFMM